MQAFAKQKQNSALVCNESATRAAVVLGLSAVSAQSAAGGTHSAQHAWMQSQVQASL